MGITAYALILPGATTIIRSYASYPLQLDRPWARDTRLVLPSELEFQFSVASVHQSVTHRYVRNVMYIARTSHGIRPVKSANKYGQGS